VDELDQFKQVYFQECEELLTDMEGHLSALSDGNAEQETLHAIFRAVHSIKGGAGAFGFDQLVAFAHTFETVLDRVRSGELEPTQDIVSLMLRSNDVLADLVRAAMRGEMMDADFGADAKSGLDALIGGGGDEEEVVEFADFDFVPVAVDLDDVHEDVTASVAAVPEVAEGPRTWVIRFLPSGEMLRKANEPLLLVRELKRLGDLAVEPDLSRLPPLADMDGEEAYLSWTFRLTSDKAGLVDIEEVFEFVRDDCELEISEAGTGSDAEPEPPQGGGGGGGGAFTWPAADAAAASEIPASWLAILNQPDPPPASAPAPEPEPVSAAPAAAAVEVKPDAPKPAAAKPAARPATAAAAGGGGEGAAAPASIRVDLEKVDRLVNMVGELVITQAMLNQVRTHLPPDQYPELAQGLEELTHHTRELQESVMAIRAQPIKSVFQRLPRLVRELAAQTGKQVRLVTAGETTEIDKTVIERLSDPLTHMIRNACDHGIEPPDERIAAGKPPEGTVVVSAEHRGGRIVIEIRDDGRGIDPQKVLNKAIQNGLVASGAGMSDEDIFNLIFLPGFSTAEQVSAISGRGVGMDVVKKNIQNAGGRVSISSVLGQGSVFTLTLPLTLAVLDGMIVRVGEETYIMPLTNIIECLRPRPGDLHTVVGGGDVIHIRGEYVPLIYLHRLFRVCDAVTNPCKGVVVMAETEEGGKVGLVVDELLGQQQVVIKSLEANYQPIDGIAAATILGSGRVALILDVSGLRAMTRSGGFPRPLAAAATAAAINGSYA
jgi:two-component system chemotaxis sensor kinase CheA